LQPTRESLRGGPPHLPLFGFAPDEVYLAVHVTVNAVSSYLTISPLPQSILDWGGFFLLH